MNSIIMHRIAFALLIVMAPISANSTTILSKKQISQDLLQLEKLIKRVHPNIYAHRSRAEINRRFKAIKSSVSGEMDIWSTAILVQKMLAAVCDEHTGLDMKHFVKHFMSSWGAARPNLLDLPLISTPDGLFLDNNYIANLKERLVSINDVPASEIKQHILDVTSVDGCPQNETVFTRLQSVSATLTLGVFLNSPDEYEMQIKSGYGSERTVTQAPLEKHQVGRLVYSRPGLAIDYTLVAAGFKLLDPPKGIKVPKIFTAMNKDKGLAYIRIRNFIGGKKQKAETNKLMRHLIGVNPKHILIDLSENSGGQIALAGHFISYFLKSAHRFATNIRMRDRNISRDKDFKWISQKRKKASLKFTRQFRRVKRRGGQYSLKIRKQSFGNPSYDGKLTILVSPLTRSAATMVAMVLKRRRNAKIIGVSAGGSTKTSCFAANGTYDLKHSKLRIKIPHVCYDRNKQNGDNNGNLSFDVKISPLATSTEILIPRTLSAALQSIGGENAE